jgi:hypothetical protein
MNEIIINRNMGIEDFVANGVYVINDIGTVVRQGRMIIGRLPCNEPANIYAGYPCTLALFRNHNGGAADDLGWLKNNADILHGSFVGTLILFSDYFSNGHAPVEVDELGCRFYRWKEPEATQRIIDWAQTEGFLVAGYVYSPTHRCWSGQNYATTLLKMDEFAEQHDIDGWYIDGGRWGSQLQSMIAMRHLAEMNQVLILHDSTSTLDGKWIDEREEHYPYGTIPSVHLRQYCTHSVCNEVVPEFQPKTADDPLWNTYVADPYGTIRSVIWADRSPMSQQAMYEAAAAKGIIIPFKRSNFTKIKEWYLPGYLAARKGPLTDENDKNDEMQ